MSTWKLPPRTSIFAAVAGGAVVILMILALAGTGGPNLLGVTLIVLGAAFVSAGLQTLRRLIAATQFSEDYGLRTPTMPGISAEVLAGGAGIVLGLLALILGNASLMASIAALVFGSVVVLQNLACQLRRCGTGGCQVDFGGVRLLVALAVIVLAILGSAGIAQYTMALVALLLLGMTALLGMGDRGE